MTILANVGSQAYAPQTANIPFVLAGGPPRVQITLMRTGWPAGLVAKAGVAWSNGDTSNAWVYGGPDGIVVQAMGVPAGVTTGSVKVEVIQGCTTPILVESL